MTKNKSEKKSNKPGKKKSSSKGENKRMKKESRYLVWSMPGHKNRHCKQTGTKS